MEQENTSIIITLNFKENNYQFSTEVIKPLITFYSEVCEYLQINPKNFNLLYNNQKLSTDINKNITLSEIIKSNENPYFQITAKKPKNKTPSKLKLKLKYDTIERNGIISKTTRKKKSPNFLTISTKDNNLHLKNNRYNNNNINNFNNINNNNDGSCGVIISQIPSVQDVENILANFNNNQSNNNMRLKTNNNFDKKEGILTVLSNNSVRIDFQDEMILNEFISYISFMKYENNYYRNMNIQKDISKIKNNMRNLSYSHKNVRGFLNNFNKKYDYNNTKMLQNERYNKNININEVIKALKQNELNNDCYHGLSLKRDGEDEIVTDYYKQQNFLRNSSPYISEEEKRILEEKESRKHFFDQHKNFITSVGKYSMKPNFIPNYVGMIPSENPNNHAFRNIDKKKWITNKGFNV